MLSFDFFNLLKKNWPKALDIESASLLSQEGSLNPYSILGLGDIAAPGLLIALMLRFDRSRVKILSSGTDDIDGVDSTDVNVAPDKTYFVTCLASYIFGLTLTVGTHAFLKPPSAQVVERVSVLS